MSKLIPRAYNTVLKPNARKQKMLKNTFEFIQKGSASIFEIFIDLMGGIDIEMMKKYPDVDPYVFCATNLFRVVIKDDQDEVPQPTLNKLFEKYLGVAPNEAAQEYFSGNFDTEKYCWADCHVKFRRLCQRINLAPEKIKETIASLIHETIIPLVKASKLTGHASASMLFGDDEKEDRSIKTGILNKILETIELNKPQTRSELNAVILAAANATNAKDFKKVYAGPAGGRPNFLDYSLEQTDFQTGTEEVVVNNFIKKCKDVIGGKSDDINRIGFNEIRLLIEEKMGSPYHLNRWGQFITNGLSDIQSKNSRNYTFANDQLETRKTISKLDQSGVSKLNAFFDSEFFNADDKYAITNRHTGDITEFLKLCDQIDNFDDCFKEQKNQASNNVMRNVLEYIYSIRTELTPSQWSDALKFNFENEKYNRQCIHPTVLGNKGATYGEHGLSGSIFPSGKMFNGKIAGEITEETIKVGMKIWTTLELLQDDGCWKKHHVPFFNSRFAEEFYAFNPNSKAPEVLIRTKRFGYKIPSRSKNVYSECLNESFQKGKSKVASRMIALKESNFPNVKDQKPSLTIKMTEDTFELSINVKVPATQSKGYKPKIGEKIIGVDQNQTTNNTLSLIEVVPENTANSRLYRGFNVVVHKTAKITSFTKIGNGERQIDQLSYPGIEKNTERSIEWRAARRKFVDRMPNIPPGVKGQSLQCQYDKVNNSQYLYSYNSGYAKLLARFMRINNMVEDQLKIPMTEIRREIVEFASGKMSILRLSSLDYNSFDAIRRTKSVLNAYFSHLLGKGNTDEQKYHADPELFDLLQMLEKKRVNKGREKINRCFDFIMNIAVSENVSCIVVESDLPTATKLVKKAKNVRRLDWLARGVVNKLVTGTSIHNIRLFQVSPSFTSHSDGTEHNKDLDNPVPKMRARFKLISPSQVSSEDLKQFSKYLKGDLYKTSIYYKDATNDFISHYGLEEYRDLILNNKWKLADFVQVMELKLIELGEMEILYPLRGGRMFLASNNEVTNSVRFVYNGREFWLCPSDEMASLSIALAVFPFKKKVPEEIMEFESLREVVCRQDPITLSQSQTDKLQQVTTSAEKQRSKT